MDPEDQKPKRGIEGRRVCKVLRAECMLGPSKRGEQPLDCFAVSVG